MKGATGATGTGVTRVTRDIWSMEEERASREANRVNLGEGKDMMIVI